MRPIGFSTGALAYANFRRGLEILHGKHTKTVELSALRENELGPLIRALCSLDLSQFTYVSIHAPSRYEPSHEREIIDLLKSVVNRRWPIILHPDTVHDFSAWEVFRDLLLIENMDKRNQKGRTAQELSAIFAKLPRARLCFDLGHCRQVDPTMNEAFLILRDFGTRLKQLHVSEVNSRSTHDPLSDVSTRSFEKISHLIPEHIPVILESPVTEAEVDAEIDRARLALPLNGAVKEIRKRDTKRFQIAVI
jgi:hypothetical protein